MADLVVEKVTTAGLNAVANSADSGGDTFPFGSVIRVANADETDTTVTMVTPGTVDGLAIDDRDIVIPAGGAVYVKATIDYRDSETGRVQLLYSKVTALTVEVIN